MTNSGSDFTASDRSAVKSLDFDPEDYRELLSEFDLSKEGEDELLEALWKMMQTMVDIGWGQSSEQLILSGLQKMVEDKLEAEEKNNAPE